MTGIHGADETCRVSLQAHTGAVGSYHYHWGKDRGYLVSHIEVYVDSGSAYTVLHARIANGVDFDYRSGERIYLQVGDGSFIPVYLHDLEVQIGTEQFTARVGFSEKLGVGLNLLGRANIFNRTDMTACAGKLNKRR